MSNENNRPLKSKDQLDETLATGVRVELHADEVSMSAFVNREMFEADPAGMLKTACRTLSKNLALNLKSSGLAKSRGVPSLCIDQKLFDGQIYHLARYQDFTETTETQLTWFNHTARLLGLKCLSRIGRGTYSNVVYLQAVPQDFITG